ncbi:MAG: DnaJ domain-containing protein [Candidatus Xenobiia bacterium LiM19]
MKWKNIKTSRQKYRMDSQDLNPYEVLGIEAHASSEEIHLAYRRLIKVYHPDIADKFMRKSSEETLKLINSAYEEVLKQKNEQ